MLSDQEMLILAVLFQTERYGYEIDKIISGRQLSLGGGVARSSVYAVLTRLYRKRLVDYREVTQSRRPPRMQYSITEAGREELEKSIFRELLRDDKILGRFEIALYVWPALTGVERKRLISSYIGKQKEKESYLKAAIEESINLTAAAFLERPLFLIAAEIRWLLKFAEESGIDLGAQF
jgi:DNA-binding PadR family transcriptional regulator